MASVEELKSVLKETLENRGVLGQIRARVRAEVFSALDDQTEARPSLSNENLLINELIREYLVFNKYKYTESVLLAETGQPKEPMDRGFLVQELNMVEEDSRTRSLPLLYGILAHFLQGGRKERRIPTRGLRDEPALYPQSRGGDGNVSDSSVNRDPILIRGGRR